MQNVNPSQGQNSHFDFDRRCGLKLNTDNMRNMYAEAIGTWLEAKGWKQKDLVEKSGLRQPDVSKYCRGEVNPPPDKLQAIAEAFGVDIPTFFSRTGYCSQDYTAVPKLSARVSAGYGNYDTDQAFEGWYSFRTDWLKRKGPTVQMRLFTVLGDSMEPDLRDGDMVMINAADKDLKEGKVYLVHNDGELLLKIAQKLPGKIVRLKPKNPHYDPIDVDMDNPLVEVVGRMVWSCREY